MSEIEIKRDVEVSGVDAQGVRATFYTKSIHNKAKSLEEGRPVYVPTIYLKVDADADNKTGWDFALKPEDWYVENDREDPRQRWSGAWKQFQEGASGTVEGTPLSNWAYIPDHRVRELNALGILSLEQLGHLPDKALSKLGPDGYSLRDGAKQYLQPADIHTAGLQRENERLRQEMENLKAEFTQLQNQRFGQEDVVESHVSPPPPRRGPGRPRKAS